MVTFYEINDDGTHGAPVLYLDTLKVSTIEQTAETSYATGGKGNTNLIAWDFGKELNITLEDALFSAKSMAIMFGDGTVSTTVAPLVKTIEIVATAVSTTVPPTWTDATGKTIDITTPLVYDADGKAVTVTEKAFASVAGQKYFVKFNYTPASSGTINISASSYPGTYYVVGDTFARSQTTGKDEYFQFIVPKAKVTAENTITLEAEGDPSVFNLSLTVLRPADGNMIKLVKYDVTESVPEVPEEPET